MIDDYKLSKHDLQNLHYFLENGFILHRKEISREKQITSEHDLKLNRTITLDIVEFQGGLEGRVEAIEEPPIPFLGNYLIRIRFENEPAICLTFVSPIWKGGYVLQKSFFSYHTKYGNHEYVCLDGDKPHYLLICMQSVQKLDIKHRVAPGVKME